MAAASPYTRYARLDWGPIGGWHMLPKPRDRTEYYRSPEYLRRKREKYAERKARQ